jgi:hypothetical protein
MDCRSFIALTSVAVAKTPVVRSDPLPSVADAGWQPEGVGSCSSGTAGASGFRQLYDVLHF